MAPDDTYSTRPLLDKLGVKEQMRIAVLGLDDPAFVELLGTRSGDVYVDKRRVGLDMIFVRFDRREELARLRTHKAFIERNGAIWVLRPKGSHAKDIGENDVREAGLDAGLVDVKVVAFSHELSAMKFVYRLKDR
jgi:DUF3052 family protein